MFDLNRQNISCEEHHLDQNYTTRLNCVSIEETLNGVSMVGMVNGILMVETGKFGCFDGKLVIHNMVYDIDAPSSKGSEPCKRQDCPYTLINAHQALTQYMYPVLFHKTA